jgi:hypothetical protein
LPACAYVGVSVCGGYQMTDLSLRLRGGFKRQSERESRRGEARGAGGGHWVCRASFALGRRPWACRYCFSIICRRAVSFVGAFLAAAAVVMIGKLGGPCGGNIPTNAPMTSRASAAKSKTRPDESAAERAGGVAQRAPRGSGSVTGTAVSRITCVARRPLPRRFRRQTAGQGCQGRLVAVSGI